MITAQSQTVDVKVLGRRVNADVEPGHAAPFGVEPEGSLARRKMKKKRQRVLTHEVEGLWVPLQSFSQCITDCLRAERLCQNMYG